MRLMDLLGDAAREGRHYMVYSRQEGNRVSTHFDDIESVERYVVQEPSAYLIQAVDIYEIPITGIRERHEYETEL